jgi:hypothetical protein
VPVHVSELAEQPLHNSPGGATPPVRRPNGLAVAREAASGLPVGKRKRRPAPLASDRLEIPERGQTTDVRLSETRTELDDALGLYQYCRAVLSGRRRGGYTLFRQLVYNRRALQSAAQLSVAGGVRSGAAEFCP